MAKGLTEKSINAIKPGENRKEVADGLQTGLYLVVQPSGQRSWAIRYRHQGKPRKATLGAYPAINLKTARKLAQAALRAASEGADPGAEKVAARKAALAAVRAASKRNSPAALEAEAAPPAKGTVAAVWAKYENLHLATKRKSTKDAAIALYKKRLSAKWGETQIVEIKRRDVLAIIDGMKADGLPAAANRAKAVISGFFSWALERQDIDASPCAGIKRPAKIASRERVLSEAELRKLWIACDGVSFPFGPMVRLMMLTGARRSEIAGMMDSELRMDDRLFVLPASRAKNARSHSIHLSDTAVGIIESLDRVANDSGYLFCARGENSASGFSKAKARLDVLMGEGIAPWVFHDIRRTVATNMQRLGVRFEVIEQCLNHSIAGVARVYQRHDFKAEMAKAFDDWSVELDRIVSTKTSERAATLVPALNNDEASIAVGNE